MRKLSSLLWMLLLSSHAAFPQAAVQRPKLVLLVAIDQFRYDYLPRFRDQYTGGLRLLLDRGANFVSASLEHYPSVTAVGHSTMLSGATPAISGIIGNDWYDREAGKQVTSVSDDSTTLLGGRETTGSSPRRLLVSTVGDEIKRSVGLSAKVIGISMKDRASILPVGRMADAAYWYDESAGTFVSSTYYFPQLPDWARAFNESNPVEQFAGKTWLQAKGGNPARRIPDEAGPARCSAVYNSPFGNDLLEQFTERAVEAERLGSRGVTDLLAVSFSSNDAVGHAYGPDSPEARAISIAVDRSIGRLFAYLDKSIGINNILVVLTSDHGVAPVPEVLVEQKMPGGRIKGDFFAPLRTTLEARFGAGQWLLSTAGTSPYLNRALIEVKHLDLAEVEKVATEATASLPNVARVYTRSQILTSRAAADPIDARVFRSFNRRRSGDLEIILDPFWIRGTAEATHGTPYNYDTHIPLVFMGPGVRAGRYYRAAALNDIAPTLAAMLDVETPSGSVGRVLDEMIETSIPSGVNQR